MALLALGWAVAGCGDDGGGDQDAAPGVDAPRQDGGAGSDAAAAADAGPHSQQDFQDCSGDGDCANPASRCIAIAWFSGPQKDVRQCLPPCSSTSECPYNTYCYPDTTDPSFRLMADRCWFSLCGPAVNPAGGATSAPCSLGAESGLPAAEQLPGWCSPIADGQFGQCVEAGTQQAGQPCDTGDRTRGGQNCDPASICTVAAGAMTGACAALCDPRSILTRPPGDTSGCAMGTDCRDASDVTVFNDGTTAPATVGFCAAVTACRLLGPNACPQGGAEPEGCTPTNPVRATGVCDPGADGPLGAGATCEVMPATPAGECAAGTICFGRSATDLTCETLCDLGAMPTVVCPGATTCQTVRWSAGLDGATGTPDDVFALSWGTCQ